MSKHAQDNGLNMRVTEGKNHTRIWIGDKYTTIPRHTEIPNQFAKAILKQIGIEP
nr:toxin HicA [Mobiluncus mulieris]